MTSHWPAASDLPGLLAVVRAGRAERSENRIRMPPPAAGLVMNLAAVADRRPCISAVRALLVTLYYDNTS